jgi:hypothetical protein
MVVPADRLFDVAFATVRNGELCDPLLLSLPLWQLTYLVVRLSAAHAVPPVTARMVTVAVRVTPTAEIRPRERRLFKTRLLAIP